MRIAEFVTEAAPNMGQRLWSKIGAKLPYGHKSKGEVQTNTELLQVWTQFKTWMGRTGYKFAKLSQKVVDETPSSSIGTDTFLSTDLTQSALTRNKILTSEMFKKTFAKTPHIDQAIKDEGIESNVTLTEKNVKNILHNAIQLKSAPPPVSDAGEKERYEERKEQFKQIVTLIQRIDDLSSLPELDRKEFTELLRTIKSEVSKSLQKATETGVRLLQLSKSYNVNLLADKWYDEVRIGQDLETLKETQNKVKLSET